MTKKRIITLSILAGIATLLLILFGVVFCLRKIDVEPLTSQAFSITIKDDSTKTTQKLPITEDMIIEASGLKRGAPIFSIDKQQVIENIQNKYPSIKVVQVKTVSAIRVQIICRQREGVYYALRSEYWSGGDQNLGYFILDEDLVIVEEVPYDDQDNVIANYVELNIEDFDVRGRDLVLYKQISNENVQYITAETFNSICETVKVKNNEFSTAEDAKFIERSNFQLYIESVSISKAKAKNEVSEDLKELVSSANIYWLTIKTVSGIKINILRPQRDLQTKINYCFAAIPKLEEGNKTIICKYDANNNLVITQHP